MKAHERTIHTYRETPDGGELELSTLVFLTVHGPSRKPRVAADYCQDEAFDADGTGYPLTPDEREAIAVEVDDKRRALQTRLREDAEGDW